MRRDDDPSMPTPGHEPPPARRPRPGDATDPRRVARCTVGIVLNFTPVDTVGSSPAALDRQAIVNDHENRGTSTRSAASAIRQYTVERLGWDAGTRSATATWSLIARPDRHAGRQLLHAPDGRRHARRAGPDVGATTAMGWEVHPAGARRPAARAARDAQVPPVPHHRERRRDARQATSSTAGCIDARPARVHRRPPRRRCIRPWRTAFPSTGYFAWSLLDNFEWAPRLRPEVRPGRGRHRDPTPHPEAQRPVVRRRRQVRRDPTRSLTETSVECFTPAWVRCGTPQAGCGVFHARLGALWNSISPRRG